MIEQYERGGDARLQAPRQYALKLNHKHVPEMTLHGGLAVAPGFMPVVGPYNPGTSRVFVATRVPSASAPR